MKAGDPPGQRQVEKHGKMWPPFPRPVGEEQAFWHKYHHAHYWPYPYNCQDKAYVQDVLHQQAAAGWTSATTLQDYHFDAETNRLNSAGETQLYWILTQAPISYRTAYVAQGRSAEQAQVRLASVEQMARSMIGESLPPILLRHDIPVGRPASEVEAYRRKQLQAIPNQRLFTIGTSGGGGGASAGGLGMGTGGMSGAPQGGNQ